MKETVRKAIAVLVALAAGYALFFSIVLLDSEKITVIHDLRSGSVVKALRPLFWRVSLAWQGAFPWWFLVAEVPKTRAVDFKARIDMPGCEDLKKDVYHVHVPVRLKYRINAARFADAARLADNGRGVDELAEEYLRKGLQRELDPYIAPVYQPEVLAARVEESLVNAYDAVFTDCAERGIDLIQVKLTGAATIPDRALHIEAMQHAANLRIIDNMLEKDLIEERNRVKRQILSNEQLYGKLREISRLIASNPELLKYIYIDKMAGNVKLILSSDSSGVPRLLEAEKSLKKGKTKEIDNLR
jgi:hypothetical protein